MKTVTEKAARDIIERENHVVVVHSKAGCPVCEYFIPEVLEPIAKTWESKGVKFIMIKEDLTFPAASHPVTYLFKKGRCIQHPSGSAPADAIEKMLEAVYG